MLRLEKSSKRDIAISYRLREPFLTRTFLTAFFIAFSLHAGAALLFHIHAFFFEDLGNSAPVSVEISLEKSNGALAVMSKGENLKEKALAPMPSEPQVSLPPFQASDYMLAFADKTARPRPIVAQAEENWEKLFCPKRPNQSADVRVQVSGPLAEVPLLSQAIPSDFAFKGPGKILQFEVEVHHGDGKVFWLNPKSEIEPALLQWAVRVVKNMRFKTDWTRFTTFGEIAILIGHPDD